MPLPRFVPLLASVLSLALSAATLRAESGSFLPLLDAGEVIIPPSAMAEADFLIAIYAERPEDLPAPAEALAAMPGPVPAGCLAVVKIDTQEGAPVLNDAGRIYFGCMDLPESAQIYGWNGENWYPSPMRRETDGRLSASFSATTIYGVFLPTPLGDLRI